MILYILLNSSIKTTKIKIINFFFDKRTYIFHVRPINKHYFFILFNDAFINSLKRGCGLFGLDLSSG